MWEWGVQEFQNKESGGDNVRGKRHEREIERDNYYGKFGEGIFIA